MACSCVKIYPIPFFLNCNYYIYRICLIVVACFPDGYIFTILFKKYIWNNASLISLLRSIFAGQAFMYSPGNATSRMFWLHRCLPARDSVSHQGRDQAGSHWSGGNEWVCPPHQWGLQPRGTVEGISHRGVDSPTQRRGHYSAQAGQEGQGIVICIKTKFV